MIKLYADLIERNLRTIEQVPLIWREKVQEELDRREAERAIEAKRREDEEKLLAERQAKESEDGTDNHSDEASDTDPTDVVVDQNVSDGTDDSAE